MQIVRVPGHLNKLAEHYKVAFELLLKNETKRRMAIAEASDDDVDIHCDDCPAEPFCSLWNPERHYVYTGDPEEDCRDAWLTYAKAHIDTIEYVNTVLGSKKNA